MPEKKTELNPIDKIDESFIFKTEQMISRERRIWVVKANKRLLLVKVANEMAKLGFDTEIDYKKTKVLIV